MSTTAAFHPVYGCLVKAEDVLGGVNRVWRGQTDLQRRFVEHFFTPGRGDVGKFPELKCVSSREAAVINKFLADNGFDLKIEELRANEFATASLFRVLDRWLETGKSSTIAHGLNRSVYPAATVTDGAWVYSCSSHNEPVAELYTMSGDSVYMTVHDGELSGLDLVARAQDISRSIKSAEATCRGVSRNFDFDGVKFPKIDLNQKVSLDWLLGMRTYDELGREWEVGKALQQTTFKMNQAGFEAKSGAAMGYACLGIPQPPLEINRPFLIWIERAGLTIPYFTARITEEDWKDPGTIK